MEIDEKKIIERPRGLEAIRCAWDGFAEVGAGDVVLRKWAWAARGFGAVFIGVAVGYVAGVLHSKEGLFDTTTETAAYACTCKTENEAAKANPQFHCAVCESDIEAARAMSESDIERAAEPGTTATCKCSRKPDLTEQGVCAPKHGSSAVIMCLPQGKNLW